MGSDYNYTFSVSDSTSSPAAVSSNMGYYKLDSSSGLSSTNSYTNMVSCTVGNCGCSGWHYYYPWYGWWWYPQAPIAVTKYLYQILCPKPGCEGKFWAEVDEIKACPKCKSKIKITDKESDYEVSVKK
jgi:hypothetical protein